MPSILSSTTPSMTLNYAGQSTGSSRTRHVASYTHRRLEWSLGVDNTLDLTVTQGDRQTMNVVNRDIVFTFWDSKSGTTYFRSRALPVAPESGAVRLVVSAADTAAIPVGLYNLSATVVDGEGLETVLTWDQDHRGSVDVELKNDIMPPSRATDVLDTWTLSDNIYVSSAVDGTTTGTRNKGLFSVAVYATDYTGVVRVQGTLDQTVNGMNTLWADLTAVDGTTELQLDGSTGIMPLDFRSNMRWIRVIRTASETNTGSIDKVLIRV